MHVRRLKQGRPSTHIPRGSEPRALRRLQVPPLPDVLTSERLTPMTAAGFRKQLAPTPGLGQGPAKLAEAILIVRR